MEFLSSPVHNYSYDTFDDAFFELPKELDFELNNDFRDNLTYSVDDDDDLNDGLYGVWETKHPWSVNSNSNSYNSNLHLDFIGGDPESAIMVNPNVVIPHGFHSEQNVRDEDPLSEVVSAPSNNSSNTSSSKMDNVDFTTEDSAVQMKKNKNKPTSARENIVNKEYNSINLPKNGIRILKPTVVESEVSALSDIMDSRQVKVDNNRLKIPVQKNLIQTKCGLYYQNDTFYPKPAFSYSCLIAMALKNSKHGCLPVAEIYNFMCNHFPYFKTAPNGWKNSVRHNLSLNKCFEKIEKPAGSTQRKGCLWALNPSKAAKLEEEVQKCTKKDVVAIKKAMEYPEHLELLERGELKSLYDTEHSIEDDDDDMDTNDEDMEGEESGLVDDDTLDEQLNETEKRSVPKNKSALCPVLNISEVHDLPEFKIEVDDSIYEELIGTIKSEQIFAVNGSVFSNSTEKMGNSLKKVGKYYIQVNNAIDKKSDLSDRNESDLFDHYDINNFLRLENEVKFTSNNKRTTPRFIKRIVTNSRMKPIKFKTWD